MDEKIWKICLALRQRRSESWKDGGRGEILQVRRINTHPGCCYEMAISAANGTPWVLFWGGQDKMSSHGAASSYIAEPGDTPFPIYRFPSHMDPKRQEVARLDWDRIWPYQANQHFVPQTLNKTAGLAVKMPSPCITLQGSACHSWKWLIDSLLWSPWNLNQFTYSQFCKKGMPQHSELPALLDMSPVSPSLPSQLLGELYLMVKVMEGLEHGA